MKNQKPLFLVLLAITFLTFFSSCSFFNIEQKTSTLSIKLPQIPSSRAITYDDDNNIKFTDGKIDKIAIDIYEISIISSNGNIITQSVENGTEDVTFSNIQIGTWTVNFNAYALDKNSKKVLVANAKKEVQIIENETTIAELTPNFIKWVFEDTFDIIIIGKEKKPLTDFVNNYENSVPITDLYSFEPIREQFQYIKISNGYIVPVKPGTEEIRIIRRFDNMQIQTSSIFITPEVKLNLFIDGQLKKSIRSSDDGYGYDNFENFEIPNDINNLLTEGQNAAWYFDKNYSQSSKITKTNNLLSLSSKFASLKVEENLFTEINLYATNETIMNEISTASEFANAFSNGGTYIIDGNNFPDGINISNTCTTDKYVKITFKNNVTIKRDYFKSKMICVTSSASLIIVPDSTSPNSYLTFDGTTIENGAEITANDKIMEINSSGNSKFQNVIFTNNKINSSYANASAIMINGTGENEFINCKVQNNSINGSSSRAPGIKIESGAKATFDGMEFSNNTCNKIPYGLDIWIDNNSATVVLKGTIKNDKGIYLHYRYSNGNNRNTIDVDNVNSTSSNFNITLGGTSDTDIQNPSTNSAIFNFGTNGENLSSKFKIYKLNNNEIINDTNSSIDENGKFIITQ